MTKAWSELNADEQAAGATLGFTEALWSAAIRSQSGMNIRTWLNGLKMSELMVRRPPPPHFARPGGSPRGSTACAAGCTASPAAPHRPANPPARARPGPEPKCLLAADSRLFCRQNIARESGVPPEQVDDALDQEAPKSVIIGLMAEQVGRPFMREWSQLSEAEAGAAGVLGLAADCFEARAEPAETAPAAPKGDGGPDEDELVLIEPAGAAHPARWHPGAPFEPR